MAAALLPLVQKIIDAHHIPHEVFECSPELADTSVFCKTYGFRLDQSANTLIVASKTSPASYAACVILPTTKLDANKALRKAWNNKRSSFAPTETALRITGMEYGGVTAFGLPSDIPIFIDSRVLACDKIVMGGGNRSSKLVIDPKELTKLKNTQVIEGLAK